MEFWAQEVGGKTAYESDRAGVKMWSTHVMSLLWPRIPFRKLPSLPEMSFKDVDRTDPRVSVDAGDEPVFDTRPNISRSEVRRHADI